MCGRKKIAYTLAILVIAFSSFSKAFASEETSPTLEPVPLAVPKVMVEPPPSTVLTEPTVKKSAPSPKPRYSGHIPTLIRQIARAHGYGTRDTEALVKLARRESRFNPKASNRGRYLGLFQLSRSMAGKHNWRDPVWNTKRAIKYIKGRYKTPSRAWAHSQRYGWY